MTWIQTYTGKAFYPLAPVIEDIDIIDIARSLSMQCRFNGHLDRFYSVAEHSVLLSDIVEPDYALWALLHDATEAYLCDLPRPLKEVIPDYSHWEQQLMIAICDRFGLPHQCPAQVKEFDARILMNERDAFLGKCDRAWDLDVPPLPKIYFGAWEPWDAMTKFLRRFSELTGFKFRFDSELDRYVEVRS